MNARISVTEDELSLALDWAAEERRNPGLFDAENFAAADPNGFFLGELGGEPLPMAARVSAWMASPLTAAQPDAARPFRRPPKASALINAHGDCPSALEDIAAGFE